MGTSDAFLKKNKKNHIFEFQKLKKYLDVVKYLSHKPAKHHVQILCIVGYAKMTNVLI
jgi:phosphopantetheine adenylyltransferase